MQKELPVRKKNRLQGYDYSNAGYYFVTICVKGGHEMLCRMVGDDAHIVPPHVEPTEYGKTVDKFIMNINAVYNDVRIEKSVVMPNHIHMIVVLQNIENGTMWALSLQCRKYQM